MGYEFDELSGRIIEAAIEVHRELGPGFIERIYENALALELFNRGISFEPQKKVSIFYAGKPVGVHRIDLIVDGQVVVELKAVKQIETSASHK